jgi:hypothetical protein
MFGLFCSIFAAFLMGITYIYIKNIKKNTNIFIFLIKKKHKGPISILMKKLKFVNQEVVLIYFNICAIVFSPFLSLIFQENMVMFIKLFINYLYLLIKKKN